ncbi:NAD-dependent succinate-semialdehyde dehydrogenase [Corynebacterium sp. P5875]|uniref:NAD-dependent succinate-semialdehyde dehydrogenase n=1 Tax=Corynebacterium antarcticum TaxID=2800405 RepID=A0A9Q4CD19_9CORY|nr:NAD-dependent succinate-semialdehyde dehydrogenase [Corynebacterium antarcticum]MCX7538621.1 NAD-dependent succinate-semialdehyde dehydrogenase [Corynebacterium antarcticum]
MTDSAINLTTLIGNAPKKLFIGGEFVAASDGGTFDVTDPSDGSVLATVSSATGDDARRALDLAVAAQDDWAATPARERSEILYRANRLVLDHTEELAYLQSAELGRALPDSRGEVAYGAEFFRWFAEEAVRITGDYRHSPSGNARIVVARQPVGPSLAVTPWNFPLAMGTRKLGPALAAGCTMIIKPASKTPLTMLYLAKLLSEAGVPDGVVSVLPTAKASNVSSLLEDPRLRKLTFTGSTEVGQMLASKAAENTVRVSLELGGNAPYVVFDDADLDAAVEAVATAKMRGAGQVCIAANRFLVHSSIKDEFVAGVVERMRRFTVGRGTDPDTTVGPLSGDDQLETVRDLVDDAKEKGAKVLLGGDTSELPDVPENGSFYPPTVLTDAPENAEIRSAEIFGPVVSVMTFDTDEEAIRMANDTPFGLAAYVFSENLTRALDAAEKIQVGMVAVNKGALSDPAAPFGGVKQSGLGREGGLEGIDEFLETKLISLPS